MVTSLSEAISAGTRDAIAFHVDALRNPPSPASQPVATAMVDTKAPLKERLFEALAGVKILTAQVAMHLDRKWRDKLFQQLDSLHDPAELEAGDEPIQQSSFATFLKAILDTKPERRPGLGLSQAGHLIAAWTTGSDRLTIEFLPDDRVIWVLARYVEDEPERFAGQTPVTRLTEGLRPYRPEHWFSHASESHEST
jgi:hypothetical protein